MGSESEQTDTERLRSYGNDAVETLDNSFILVLKELTSREERQI
jgi:hypothetical protein